MRTLINLIGASVLAGSLLFPGCGTKDISEKATEHQLNAQMMSMEFYREYPEANKNYQEKMPAIGFAINNNSEEDGICEDDECRKIGY